MDDKRAMTWQEFVDSDFDGQVYEFPDFEGTCFATIACKRWNKSRNLLVYLGRWKKAVDGGLEHD